MRGDWPYSGPTRFDAETKRAVGALTVDAKDTPFGDRNRDLAGSGCGSVPPAASSTWCSREASPGRRGDPRAPRRARHRRDEDAGRRRHRPHVERDGSVWPPAIAAIRLLVPTGCRHSESVSLRWDDVDRTAGEPRLRDGKTGPRMVPPTEPLGGGARRHSARARQTPGDCRAEAGHPLVEPPKLLASGEKAAIDPPRRVALDRLAVVPQMLAELLSDEESQGIWAQAQGALSPNVGVDESIYTSMMKRALAAVGNADTSAFNYDLATPPPSRRSAFRCSPGSWTIRSDARASSPGTCSRSSRSGAASCCSWWWCRERSSRPRSSSSRYSVAWGVQGALSPVASVPTLVMFLFFQRYFIAGMTMGAVKG